MIMGVLFTQRATRPPGFDDILIVSQPPGKCKKEKRRALLSEAPRPLYPYSPAVSPGPSLVKVKSLIRTSPWMEGMSTRCTAMVSLSKTIS